MRFSGRSLASACLTFIALGLAACAPAAPTGDATVAVSTGAGTTAPAPADVPVPPTTPAQGPTYDAPCTPVASAARLQTPRSYAYARRADIRACVTFHTQSDGGRRTPVFGGYRPVVRFADVHGAIVATPACALRFDAQGAVEPGSTVAAYLKCEEPVAIGDGSAFALVEGGREVGIGTVVLPPG